MRRERNISTSALARAIGVSSTAISKIESGDTAMPRADHLLRIAAELGADPVRLVFGEDSEEYRRINGAWPDAYTDRAAARAAKQRHLLATIVDAFIDECQRQADQAAASGK
jgi:transcriptional regulator with XRE-family HTH domain